MGPLPEVIEDTAIIRNVLAGDIDAFELLLDRYQDHVAQIVRKHVPWDYAPEVAHETFVRTYQSLPSFRGTKPFKHWLSKIAVRCCHDFWREHYKRQEATASSISEDCRLWLETFLVNESQEKERERFEARDLLHWALGQLSPGERTVLTLTFLEEHSVAEAAALLGWSVPRVRIQSYRARSKLRKILGKILPQGWAKHGNLKGKD